MSGNISSRAPGTARAVAMPPLGSTSRSRSPWMTRVGTRTSARAGVRSGLAWMASSCRIVPSGLTSREIAERTMPPTSSASKWGPAMSRNPATPSRSASAGSSGRGVVIDIAMVGKSRGETVPWRRLPVFDMIEQRLSTRSGWSMVSCWAIIPPMETPTTCAAGTPRWSSSATASAAMSESR